ncbi:MAG TPA: HPr-rel-A system PqqD family peptide chaperone [Phycisphaerae bacterium]|mgnify:CR=1 FL=1|nr:HPr-rel-A system PqqD family peptide chaperone [Phycisphaerales bacterium]HRX87661.1 HPr-rel-A system PqqD family peptide chaperone [Phycisphaerae bacterium]
MTLQATEHWARHLTVVVPRRRPGVTSRLLEGDAVLYDAAGGRMHRMNETALHIWNACDGKRTTDEVAAEIAARYDVPHDTARADVEQTLAALALAGLLEEGSA